MELRQTIQDLKGLSAKIEKLELSADTPEGVREILSYLIALHVEDCPHTGLRGMYRNKAVQRIVGELNALQDDGAAFDDRYVVSYQVVERE